MSSAPPDSEPAPPRGPGVVLAVIVTALGVLVGTLSLQSRSEAPPTVAEFAPQAVTQIRQALSDEAGLPGAATSPSPVPSPAASRGTRADVAALDPVTGRRIIPGRVRACVGSPPRQTEDPQSPPCVPYFDPKTPNGGATARGVTADSIVVAVPVQFFEEEGAARRLAGHFNARYELYGRKLVLKTFQPSGCTAEGPDRARMRADAVAVQEELQAFASLAYCNAQGVGADQAYYDALAERGVVSVVDGNLTRGTEAAYTRQAPYQWNVMAGTDAQLASTAQWVCATLAGRSPRYAGGREQQRAERRFGLIVTRAPDGTLPDLRPLREGLRTCDVTPTEVEEAAGSQAGRNGVAAIARLSDAGVTSVLCLCSVIDTRSTYMPAATSQGYQPEWLLTSYGGNDLDNSFSGGNAPPDQVGHVLGLTFRNKLLPRQDMPWYWASREADPSTDPEGNRYYANHSRYVQLLLLASGIQSAGPHLTAEAFERGLHRLRFPNPRAGSAPLFQARVGFPGGRHVMTADAAMFWYDPNRPGTVDPTVPGSVCYVDRGRRTSFGGWRREDPAYFRGPCL